MVGTNPGATVQYNPNNPFNVDASGAPLPGTGNYTGSITTPTTSPTATVPPPTVVTPSEAQANAAAIGTAVGNIQTGVQTQKANVAAQPPTTQTSVVDYMNANGQDSSYANRSKLATQYGIQNYSGTAAQNTQLLGILQTAAANKAAAPAPTPTSPTPGATASAVTGIQTTLQPGQSGYVTNADGTYTYYSNINGQIQTNPTNPIGGDQQKNTPQQTPGLVQLSGTPTLAPSTSTEAANANIAGETTDYQNNLDTLNNETDAMFNDYESKLQQIQNGTFPLTATQLAIVQATQNQFDQLRQQQVIANTAYTQGMQVMEARTGELTGGTTTALGNIQNAINTGVQKLADLDAKAASTLATLQEGFQQDNLKMIQAGWDAWQQYKDDKEKTLTDIYTATVTAQKDLRDFAYKTTQDLITNTLNSDKFTYQQKQDKIDTALTQAQLDETKRASLVAEAQKQQALNLQQQANAMIQNTYSDSQLQGIPQSLPDGSPNPLYQTTFLSTLPPMYKI